ncbi:sex peptide receptor-like [Pomacea canaliculata]|nr:sex peptide receptor-like [Pomacea canaliculata]XP_025082835.1 sex peptide receptor-like [Pomacea canaliculata]XP_025082836.1 sex peptide receptor-like [Pomacea canaliculata]XP_025082837.1 sex peptide receptor-like [Pomacea canaliculata]
MAEMKVTALTGFSALPNVSESDWFTPALLSTAAPTVGKPNMGNATIHQTPSDLEEFCAWYRTIHGVAAPIICALGIVANCLNIVVLTRKNMVSPTNVLLTGLAISDGLTMAAYFPYAILNYHIYLRDSPLANAKYIMFFAIFSVIVHSISIWLTVSLAVFRYIFIRYPRRGAKLCSIQRANITIAVVCVIVTAVCIPNSVSYYLVENRMEGSNTSLWGIDVRGDAPGYIFLQSFNLWIQAILVKLLPCFLLAILSILLIKQMKDAERRRKKLLNKNGKTDDESKRHRKTNRTTRMLVAVVVLFFVTETPQGVLQLLGGVVDGFFHHVYVPLGDMMDTLALINNGINFVLYCTMSKQFRDTFIRIFLCDLNADNSKRSALLMSTQPTRDTEV